MASAVDSRLAYARLSAVATASRLPTANRGSNNSYTTSWDTTKYVGPTSETVRTLFRLYLKYANVRLVKEEADRLGLRTKTRKPNNGRRRGGEPFTRGHIYKLLANPTYVGEIVHSGARYEGDHEAVIDRETWDAVQEQLRRNAVNRLCMTIRSPQMLRWKG